MTIDEQRVRVSESTMLVSTTLDLMVTPSQSSRSRPSEFQYR